MRSALFAAGLPANAAAAQAPPAPRLRLVVLDAHASAWPKHPDQSGACVLVRLRSMDGRGRNGRDAIAMSQIGHGSFAEVYLDRNQRIVGFRATQP